MHIPHIRTLARSHRDTLCARILILHQCTANRDGISVVTIDQLPLIAAIRAKFPSYLTAKPEITQTDHNHGCSFTDKRYILPRIRGVFTADFNVTVWKHQMRLGVVFGIGIMCVICVTKQGRIKTDANVVSHVDCLRESFHIPFTCYCDLWNVK